MANPQLEDGYTEIANEILDSLAHCQLSPNEWQVLICIIRKTYGYHKKVDYIANFQIVMATGLCKAVVSRVLGKLAEKRLITRNKKYIGFQKDWEIWKLAEQSTIEKLAEQSTLGTKLAEQSTLLDNKKLAVQSTELAVQSTKVSSPRVTQNIKDNIQKKDNDDNHHYGADTPASKYLFEKTGRKRWANLVQKELFEETETGLGFERMKEAINWALASGISNIKSIITAAKKGGKSSGINKERPRAIRAHSEYKSPEEWAKLGV